MPAAAPQTPKQSAADAKTAEINRRLLQATILVSALPAPNEMTDAKALEFADAALADAQDARLPTMQAKAQLMRGHCLRLLGRWEEAHAAYVRAASVASFSRDVEQLTSLCQAHIRSSSGAKKEKEKAAPGPAVPGEQQQPGMDGELRDSFDSTAAAVCVGLDDELEEFLLNGAGGDFAPAPEKLRRLRSLKGRSVHNLREASSW